MRLFLVGFMGAGKSYWAQRWAMICGLQSMDLDNMIEKASGKSIQQIFTEDGETYFRDLEAKLLRQLGAVDDFILACGGGTPCFNHNLQWMQSMGRLVYLEACPSLLLERLKGENVQRPLLAAAMTEEEKLSQIEKLLEERQVFYTQADHVLPAESLHDELILEILP